MLSPEYLTRAKTTIRAFDPGGGNRYFLFGSAARRDRFGDVDIGVVGNAHTRKDLMRLREQFEESTFPYFVDIVDFDSVSKEFSAFVREEEPLIWLN